MSKGRRQIVKQIKSYAADEKQYTNGWDVVIETLTDEQIAVLTGKTGGFAGARVRVSKWVRRDPKFLASLPADFAS